MEQADRWRQTYVVTDEGPSYRPGENLYVLSPPRPNGQVTPLTHFQDGWIGEPELSWDAQQVIFTRREKDRLWWHIWRMNIDGSDLQQLTHGPYHHVGPAFLPDGRIVVSTQGGLTLIGPHRDTEQLISPDFKTRAYTTPVPLSDGALLCATTLKTPDRKQVDLGLYRFDPHTGTLDLIYNDPATADYEPRPIIAHRPPPVMADSASRDAYSGRFLCASVFNSQEKEVAQRGRLVRLIEGVPVVGRHESAHRRPACLDEPSAAPTGGRQPEAALVCSQKSYTASQRGTAVKQPHSAQDQLQVVGRQFADQAVVGRDDRVGQFPLAVLE